MEMKAIQTMKTIKVSIIICALILSSLMLLNYANSEVPLSGGKYESTMSSLSYIKLDLQKNKFEFIYNSVLSYIPQGSFEVDGKRLVATYTWHGGEEVYVFRIIDDETLEFLKDESANIPLEDGNVFKISKSLPST